MSVILDALRRVQDEGRGRERATPGRRDAQPHGDAMLRRLAEGGEGPVPAAGPRTLTRSTRMALLVLGLAVIVAGALWAFQPSLGTDGNASPLLASLTGAGQQPGRPVAAQAVPDPEPQAPAPTLFEDLVAVTPSTAEPAAWQESSDLPQTEVADTPPAGNGSNTGDYRDLSGSLGSAEGAWEGERTTTAPSANDTGYLDLTSSFTPAAPEAGSSRVDMAVDRDATESRPRELVDPGVRVAFAEGVRLQKAGDMVGAEDAYKRALKHDPYNAKVNANLGVLYESTNRFAAAERHLRQSVAVEPDNANAHNNLGVVLYRMGSYEAALSEFNRTLELDPDRLDAYINKGLIYTRWGRYEDAESAFLQVIARDASNALAHYNLGLVYEETDELDRALDRYYEFIALGAADHPEITQYLADHLPWLEARVDAGTSRNPR